MSDLAKRPNDGLPQLVTLLTVVGLAALARWPITLIAHLGGEHLPLNPAAMAIALAEHRAAWAGSTVLVLYAVQAAALVLVLALVLRSRPAALVVGVAPANDPASPRTQRLLISN